ncbi:MAG: archease [Candidatus Omnitrophica bacterium]|nr:archease [Candidatus Omnitrophota bacterium]
MAEFIPYEVVEHTAEIGIKGRGRSRQELFAHMAEGMFSLIAPPEEVQPRQAVSVEAESDGWDRLLVAWLKELLYRFDTGRFLGRSFRITRLDPFRLEAVASGEPLDLSRHHVDKEVKAVTYCDLSIAEGPDGIWVAQVIFDI